MRGGVDRLQGAQGDAGVDLGAGDVSVAEHLLHLADVGAAFSSIRAAIVWRNRWQAPGLPILESRTSEEISQLRFSMWTFTS